MPISATTSGGWAGPIFRPAIVISGDSMIEGALKARCRGLHGLKEEKPFDEILQFVDRFDGVHANPELGAAFKPLCVPGAQRAHLVDDPALSPDRLLGSGPIASASRCRMPEAFRLVDIVGQQQV